MRNKLLLYGQSLIEKGAWYFAPISWVFACLCFVRNWLYDRELLPITHVPCTVVSVGNIVAGGTGKTPFVIRLAQAFSHKKVAVLSRGYGSDEPKLLAIRLPNAKIYVGKNRAHLAKQAAQDGAELILLDDGFQHRKLHRDFDIVLDSKSSTHFLPWGFLRDSPKRLKTADAVFAPTYKVRRILESQGTEVPSIKGWKVGLFAAIAKPSNFKKTVDALGASISAEWLLFDHEVPNPEKLKAFVLKCKSLGVRALICTEKDFVKLSPSLTLALPLLYLEIEIEVEGWENLVAKIAQRIDNGSTYER
jgi:tetraacyldisaccharide 4'-kinase